MPRREPSDPSAALARVQAGFTGGATGILESLKQRREGGQRIQELLLAGRLRREEQAADPEFQAKQAALQAIEELTPFPQALSSANAPPEKRNRLQELFRGRMTERLGERAKLSEMFGLVPRRQPTAAETIAEFKLLQENLGQDQQQLEPGVSGTGKAILRPTAEAEGQRQATIRAATKRAEIETEQAVTFGEVKRTVGAVMAQLAKIPPPTSQPAGSLTRGFRNLMAKGGFEPALNEFITASNAMMGQLSKTVGL